MARILTVLMAALFVLQGGAAFGQVEVVDSGDVTVPVTGHKYSMVRRNIDFKNGGPVSYAINYFYVADPLMKEEYPKSPFPAIGDASASTNGIGLSAPWYGGGFWGIRVDGKDLRTTVVDTFKTVSQGKRGVADVVWKPDWGKVTARFVTLQGDDKIFMEVRTEPRTAPASVKTYFTCIPGHPGAVPKRDQWISTCLRSVQHSEEAISIQSKEEPWVLLYDTANNYTGTCALICVPDQIVSHKVNLSGNRVAKIEMDIVPAVTKMRFLIFNFPDTYKTREEAYSYLKENGEGLLEELVSFNFDAEE
ncbi:MAG: hypothetical protein PHT33_05215 [bacterium]|nr:hypothetical protein [bacterium]